MSKHFWTVDEDARLLTMTRLGYGIEHIADLLGRKVSATNGRVKELKRQRQSQLKRGALGSPWTERDDAMMLRLHADGHVPSEIADMLGRGREAIRDRIRKLKLEQDRTRAVKLSKVAPYQPVQRVCTVPDCNATFISEHPGHRMCNTHRAEGDGNPLGAPHLVPDVPGRPVAW